MIKNKTDAAKSEIYDKANSFCVGIFCDAISFLFSVSVFKLCFALQTNKNKYGAKSFLWVSLKNSFYSNLINNFFNPQKA